MVGGIDRTPVFRLVGDGDTNRPLPFPLFCRKLRDLPIQRFLRPPGSLCTILSPSRCVKTFILLTEDFQNAEGMDLVAPEPFTTNLICDSSPSTTRAYVQPPLDLLTVQKKRSQKIERQTYCVRKYTSEVQEITNKIKYSH